ncbi:MAG TPA: thiolase family protein [Candidatus Wallbacteria bacterium]|nr:thiolase family protein [Candidatus Wallbacteria bacterium]
MKFKKEANDVVIVAARRSPVAKFTGAFADMKAPELMGRVIKAALEDAKVNVNDVEETIVGCVVPAGIGQNPARQAILKAGASEEHGAAVTVNKVCGSGLYAVMAAARAIKSGDLNVAVAGGMEVMSQNPHYIYLRKENKMGETKVTDAMLVDGLLDFKSGGAMGNFAEGIGKKYGVTREDQDKFAVNSYEKALKAMKDGKFKKEIVPIELTTKKGTVIMDTDEIPSETTMETASKARAAFVKDGTVTAINASKLADGASCVVLMNRAEAEKRGLKPLAAIKAYCFDDVEIPELLVSPIKSIPNAIKKAGIEISDVDLFEINEAFSVSSAAINKTLGLPAEKVNIYGGGVAMGHPVGSSGARILVTLLNQMAQEDKHVGVASLCIGGGEGIAMVLARE